MFPVPADERGARNACVKRRKWCPAENKVACPVTNGNPSVLGTRRLIVPPLGVGLPLGNGSRKPLFDSRLKFRFVTMRQE